MFDIGFSELMVIGVVALIVIGPERLPKVARTVGHLFGRMQRYVNDVKADISREMELDELRKLQASMQDAARSFESSVNREVQATETEFQKIAQEANPMPLPAPAESTPAAPPSALETTAAVDTPAAPGQLTPAEASAQLELDMAAPATSGEKRA
jgi:sec-independent protein translocase protein TatB